MKTHKVFRIGAAIVLPLAVAFGVYWLSQPAPPTAPEIAYCKRSTCGPLELLDCATTFDGPLFVYERFSGRYLGDCGQFSASLYDTGLCRSIHRIRNMCVPPGSQRR